jgi:hypothetical protein
MKLRKLPYEPGGVADFFTDGLRAFGAVCERSWHDRVQVLAEGDAARLWNENEALIETELRFTDPGDTLPKDAGCEVFAGCPLLFRLCELVRGKELTLDRCAIEFSDQLKAPSLETAAKTWQAQFPNSSQWKMESILRSDWSFALLAILRCEVQAIDQHWSLHRLAISLPDGARDPDLETRLDFAQPASGAIAWPSTDPSFWASLLGKAVQEELEAGLAATRSRQEAYLRRELERIDNYFSHYEQELCSRGRSGKEGEIKLRDRLAATRAEHQRRRDDQVHRHQIRIIPHVDALMLVAEPCWSARVSSVVNRSPRVDESSYLPRSRRWKMLSTAQ